MKQSIMRQPVILLVGRSSKENDSIKILLESNNFSTREAADIYDALDEISDFTVDRCPDVFMLPVNSPAGDFATIEELVEIYSENNDILVATFSGVEDGESPASLFNRQLSRTKTKVNILPRVKIAALANNIL